MRAPLEGQVVPSIAEVETREEEGVKEVVVGEHMRTPRWADAGRSKILAWCEPEV